MCNREDLFQQLFVLLNCHARLTTQKTGYTEKWLHFISFRQNISTSTSEYVKCDNIFNTRHSRTLLFLHDYIQFELMFSQIIADTTVFIPILIILIGLNNIHRFISIILKVFYMQLQVMKTTIMCQFFSKNLLLKGTN